jgi:hypothetical protein
MLCVTLVSFFLLFQSVLTVELKSFIIKENFLDFATAVSKIMNQNFFNVNIIKVSQSQTENDLVERILQGNNVNYAVRLDDVKHIQTVKNRKKRFSIIPIDNIKSFHIFKEQINPKVFSFSGIFVFILIDGKIADMKEIFSTLWKRNIYNVDILFQNEDSIDVMTFMPFSRSTCDDTTPRIINRFVNGSFEKNLKETIFPMKFENLRKCEIKIATYEENPNVIRKKNSDGSEKLSDFDMEIIDEISKALNFEKKIEFIEGPDPWGLVLDNGTVTGALNKLVNGKAQIAIGSMFLVLTKLKHVDASESYFHVPEVFVLSSARKLTSFEKLLQPFDAWIWILISLTFLIAFLVIFIINRKIPKLKSFVFGTGINDPELNVVIAIFGGSQPKLPKRNFSRFLLMKFLIFCMIFRNAYQGALFKFIQSDQRNKNPQTISELAEQNYDFYVQNNTQPNEKFKDQPKILAR